MSLLVEFFSFPFLQRAILAGIVLAIVTAILGVFVVLRRMSFFSDAIAHASLLGIALGLLINLSPTVGAIAFSIVIGLLMAGLIEKKTLSSDTIIGVLFSTSIALAIFIISIMQNIRVDLSSLLFGDILTVTTTDIILSLVLLISTLLFMKVFFKPMMKYIFNVDIALVENKSIKVMNYLFLTLLAGTIAVSLKIVGAILVSALVIIPAATAQNISKNIRQLLLLAVIIAIISVVAGMILSFAFNTPSGATIVLTLGVFFVLSLVFKE